MPSHDCKREPWAREVSHAVPSPVPSHDCKREPEEIYCSVDAEQFARDVRQLQHNNKCSDKTCVDFITLFNRYVNGDTPSGFKTCDKKLKQAAGFEVIELHGCSNPECNGHVYGPEDKRTRCPCCGEARYDAKTGKATERVFYFPLKPRLRKLFKVAEYRKCINHEFERPRNDAYMADVYDSPAWKQFMGDAEYPIQRIALLFCVDGIPAFAAGTLSLKPMEFINLSLPPGVRSKSENIMLLMLLPSNLSKGKSQKKYYDFAAAYELNELATTGIDGVKIKVFTTSMDTKGREELLGL